MPRPPTDKRERLADAALDLAYRRGFEQTSIADIASHAGVAAGSVYYYFKTKDDVAEAIVEHLGARYRAAMTAWDAAEDPRERLIALADTYVRDASMVSEFGCPLGAVVAELSKHSDGLGRAAGAVLAELVAWCAVQFEALGYAPDAAHARATHAVAVLQGAASLSQALASTAPLEQEAAHLVRWIRRGQGA
jgi:AcrR family transcriptional regulator